MTGTIRFDELRRRNRRIVVAAVRDAMTISRTELARRTGLSHSTISAIASDLLSEGVLREARSAEPSSGRRGRPQVALEFNPAAGFVVTAVLSLNQVAVSLVDFSGKVRADRTLRLITASASSRHLGEAIAAEIAAVMGEREDGEAPVLRVALAVQGVTDAGARVLRWSPITPHRDVPFAQLLEQRFQIPVTVENDCSVIALALRKCEPLRYGDEFVTILLSHGIGMGLVLRGQVFSGTVSSAAEFGHMIHEPGGAHCRCGRRGCIEAYAGNYAIWRRAHALRADEIPDDVSDEGMLALAERARACEGPERQAFREAAQAIGFGLGSLFALVDPAPVAFVGVGAASFDLLEPAIRESLDATAGGQRSGVLDFTAVTNEMPLIREGCALRALTLVDAEVVAPGAAPAARREVA